MDLSLNGVLKHLYNFGYLALPNDADGEHLTGDEPAGLLGKLTSAAQEAIEAYHRFFHLPIEAVGITDVMLAHMCQRRCNHPDRPYALSQAQVMKWNKTDLRWKFVNYTLDIPQHEISDSFEIGFRLWSKYVPLNFREVLKDDEADIEIRFDTIDGQSNVLAQTWFPPVGKMEYDEGEMWSHKLPIGRGQVDLATVHTHEAGHLIGLEHTNVPGSQMLPVYNGAMRFLGPDDIRRAQQNYGSRS